MVGHVLVSPEAVLAAAAELDLVADRLAGVAALSGPVTHVVPSGVDEVSMLAASHLNNGAVTHDGATAQAVLELHHAAATLRLQLAQYLAEDAVRAGTIAATAATLAI
ncbi:PE family protein [Nocardia arthritidis]|uniref:PE domain-containing protein n=1 Tax=Nocardia arthritidis TaxID=228602 RepID=A0A6G9Y496_9NOCA|nr:PE family protein [Nocardia arthritidis]QIS08048.1 PE domain-containing protein [Nocardia arthritidis]